MESTAVARKVLDLSDISLLMGNTRFTHLEHGVIVGNDGQGYYQVESMTKPGHIVALKVGHECYQHLVGQELTIRFIYTKWEREHISQCDILGEGSEVIFDATSGFKPFVETYQVENDLALLRQTVIYRAIRDGSVLVEDSDAQVFCSRVDSLTPTGPMAALAALQSPIKYEMKKYGQDWVSCNRVPGD